MHFSKLILTLKNNIKKSWHVIKEAIAKEKYKQQPLPKTESIAESFNKYFTQNGPRLAKDIGTSTKIFNEYMKNNDTTQPEKVIFANELEDAFFFLKTNESAGYDDINLKCCEIYHISLQTGIFHDKPKIPRVTPLFKGGENYELGNYRPIPVLPCFSKILQKNMYNLLYKYLTDNSILYKKHFGFQEGNCTEHAIVQLVDQIRNIFESKQYSSVFVDLSKAFNTVNHQNLFYNLKNHKIRGKSLLWFISYLTNRTQFIKYNNLNTSFQKIVCDVRLDSALGPLLFLMYVNDLKDASKSLDCIMFAGDTNLFYFH